MNISRAILNWAWVVNTCHFLFWGFSFWWLFFFQPTVLAYIGWWGSTGNNIVTFTKKQRKGIMLAIQRHVLRLASPTLSRWALGYGLILCSRVDAWDRMASEEYFNTNRVLADSFIKIPTLLVSQQETIRSLPSSQKEQGKVDKEKTMLLMKSLEQKHPKEVPWGCCIPCRRLLCSKKWLCGCCWSQSSKALADAHWSSMPTGSQTLDFTCSETCLLATLPLNYQDLLLATKYTQISSFLNKSKQKMSTTATMRNKISIQIYKNVF